MSLRGVAWSWLNARGRHPDLAETSSIISDYLLLNTGAEAIQEVLNIEWTITPQSMASI